MPEGEFHILRDLYRQGLSISEIARQTGYNRTEGAHAFFQLISQRYETRSIVFTSNKSYVEWGEIFGDHVIASDVLDRILHHCTTINIKARATVSRNEESRGYSIIIVEKFS